MNLGLFYYDCKKRDLSDIKISDFIYFGDDLVSMLKHIDPKLDNKGSIAFYTRKFKEMGCFEFNHDSTKGILMAIDYQCSNLPNESVEQLAQLTKTLQRDSKIEELLK